MDVQTTPRAVLNRTLLPPHVPWRFPQLLIGTVLLAPILNRIYNHCNYVSCVMSLMRGFLYDKLWTASELQMTQHYNLGECIWSVYPKQMQWIKGLWVKDKFTWQFWPMSWNLQVLHHHLQLYPWTWVIYGVGMCWICENTYGEIRMFTTKPLILNHCWQPHSDQPDSQQTFLRHKCFLGWCVRYFVM